jgi:hypothetical protein
VSGGGKKFRTFTSKEWDRYSFGGYYLSATYSPAAGTLEAITTTLPAMITRPA